MMIVKRMVTTGILLMFLLAFKSVVVQRVDAQESIAQQAYTILEQNCRVCHGEDGDYKDDLLLDRTNLVETTAVIPGSPENSELYKRLIGPGENGGAQMPLGGQPLSQESIDTIARWITEGAPDWISHQQVNFISFDTIYDSIQTHLTTLPEAHRPYARYFTLTHLYNAGVTTDTLNDYRIALSKLVNSLSWGRSVTNPTPIDPEKTVLYIDLRSYNWETGINRWTQIEEVYPYHIEFSQEKQTGLFEKLTSLRAEMKCRIPYVYADWFLATASLPPLYNSILELPESAFELEQKLDIDVAGNIQNAAGLRVWRAGFNNSGVSNHNRVVERHESPHGAYWKSFDFAGSSGLKSIFTYPLSFQHDGGEIIFNLPNGLQAYFLVDADGNKLDVAPTDIVANSAASDPAVRNGLSCIGCHSHGMREFDDQVRDAIQKITNPTFDKELALLLYPEQSVFDELLQSDSDRFLSALIEIGGPFNDAESEAQYLKRLEYEPVQRFHEVFIGSLNSVQAAAAVGLENEMFLSKIREIPTLQTLLSSLLTEGGTVKRDTWTANFPDVITGIYDELTPKDDTPIITEGAVYIPDNNLRSVIEEIRNKAPGSTITQVDMETLRIIVADDRGITDLRGLQFATNLERIEFRRNAISDLSPIAGLTKLNNIKLRSNQITNVTPLENLTRVDWLGLEQNQITDLSPLTKLTKLEGIGITGNPITDVSPLAKLTSLQRIDAWRTPITDFSVLSALPRLNWIEYGNNRLTTELPSFEGLTALTRLEIHGCSLTDLTPLEKLTQLEWLELVNNGISDLSPLRNLKNLTTLNLDANIIENVSPLASLTNLKILYLENNVISDVTSLKNLTKLERLDLRNNALTDFSFISQLSPNTFVRTVGNPGFPKGGSKIKGPWLWVIVPGTRLDENTDFLAQASKGAATETKVSTNGAVAGKAVGESVWTWHHLQTTGNNINDMTESLGWGTGSEIYDHIIYGSVTLDSPSEQLTRMFVGSDDSVKVWLNGELVHRVLSNRGGTNNYEDVFPVTLKQGKNALLVAVDNHGHGGFSGYFGFAPDTQYTVFRPGTRFVFNVDATSYEVGDTFTLDLKTENVRNLAGWQADILFNPNVLKALEVSQGDFLITDEVEPRFDAGTIQNEVGKIVGINAIRVESSGVNGNGTLCSVRFTVIGTGESLLMLENFEAGTRSSQPISSVTPELLITVTGDEPRLKMDVNQDNRVDIMDLIQVAQSFGSNAEDKLNSDVNGDGLINIFDLIAVAQNFGESTASAPTLVLIKPGTLTPAMVKGWIDLAQDADNGSIAFRDGIAKLQVLLETITVPNKTKLLVNYPNPFNPETWIPYQLAAATEVNMTIYAANGTLVRTITLGHQPAGIYRSRTRAAYWDGKNEIGEPVASGVYFYTFKAGDFTATRKMFIRK